MQAEIELLYRNGRGVILSEAGKLLDTYAQTVVSLVDKAKSEIGALKAEPHHSVTIAMPPSIGWMLTGPLVVRCREAFPEIVLHLAEGFSGHVAEWLSTGRRRYRHRLPGASPARRSRPSRPTSATS